MTGNKESEVGYGKPPVSTRFKKGQSGNPRGRPPGRRAHDPYESVLGQKVTVRENGETRTVTAAEAFLLNLTRQGLEGNSRAASEARKALAEVRARRGEKDEADEIAINRVIVAPGSVNAALEPLRMAIKLDRHRDTARMALEPWLVEAALERLGSRQLTLGEQRKVIKATRTPHKVKWPEWWKAKP